MIKIRNCRRSEVLGFYFENNVRSAKDTNHPYLRDIAVVVFKRGETKLYWKERRSDKIFKSENFSQRNLVIKLTVNTIWGVVPTPLTEKKFVKKNGKCNQDDFLQVLPKFSWTTFKTIFEALSALGVCHVTITGGMVNKKSMIFKVFGVYLSEFLIFLHEIFFGSKILLHCQKEQMLSTVNNGKVKSVYTL